MRKLGELGLTGPEARDRLKRLFNIGLDDLMGSTISAKEQQFLTDMKEALDGNEYFEPSYGQVTWAQDIFNRYFL